MKKCILIAAILALAGCSSETVRWKDAGTLVSVSPSEESTRFSGRRGTMLGDTEWGRSRVETTEGVYIVVDKVSVSQPGAPVRLGYVKGDSSDVYQEKPSYIAFGDREYKIAP